MEYASVWLGVLGVFTAVVWALDFWGVFRKRVIYFDGIKSNLKRNIKILNFILGLVAWCFLSYSFLSPRESIGFSKENIEVNDIFFVIDVSRSMIADDFKPNRLEAAKAKIAEFVSLRPKDRIGIIVFADQAFTLLPLSTDLELIQEMVGEIRLGLVGNGTNIGDALGLAVARGLQSLAKNKVIILLTDGVSNVGTITPLQAAQQAKENKIKVYTIGIGGNKNVQINLGGRLQLIPGGSIDLETLKEISKITRAKSYVAKDGEALQEVLEEIEQLERTEVKKSRNVIYKEKYYWYFCIGFLLLLCTEFIKRFYLREVI